MLAASVRSGLVETYHEGAVAVCDADGNLIAHHGDIDRPFYIRSASKPFQATISQEAGAGLSPLEMAVVCSSHRGHPVQVSLVESVLEKGGLTAEDLQCPPAWPSNHRAARALAAAGHTKASRAWHNCSGKHSGFLRACVANGWSVQDYRSPDHPLQQKVTALIGDLGGFDPEPVGVDGCGAPVHRTTVRAMARMFVRLPTDSRFAEAYTAMHRYPALIGENGADDSRIATSLHAVGKGGAQACLGIGLASGHGLAVKSWDGVPRIPGVAAVAALEQLGLLNPVAGESLSRTGRPEVRGGDDLVGHIEPRFELEMT